MRALVGSQNELGEILGVVQQAVSNKLRGKVVVTVNDLIRLAAKAGVNMTYFFEKDEDPAKLLQILLIGSSPFSLESAEQRRERHRR